MPTWSEDLNAIEGGRHKSNYKEMGGPGVEMGGPGVEMQQNAVKWK
jgi:hypothetical protein